MYRFTYMRAGGQASVRCFQRHATLRQRRNSVNLTCSPCSLLLYQVLRQGSSKLQERELRLRAIHENSVAFGDTAVARSLLGTWCYGTGGLTSYSIKEEGQDFKFVQGEAMGSLTRDGDWWKSLLSKDGEAAGKIRLRQGFDNEGPFLESCFMEPGCKDWNEAIIARASIAEVLLPQAVAADNYSLANLQGGELVQFKATVRLEPPWYMSFLGATESVVPGVFGLYNGMDQDNCLIRPVVLHQYDPSLPPDDQPVYSVDSGPLTAWNGKTEVRVASKDVEAGSPDLAWSPHTPFMTAAARSIPGFIKHLEIEVEQTDSSFRAVPDVGRNFEERLALLKPSSDPYVDHAQLYLSKFRLRLSDGRIVLILVGPVIDRTIKGAASVI